MVDMSVLQLVALHGFTGRGASWRPVLESLPDVEAYCPDLPGHAGFVGELPVDFESTLELLAEAIAKRFVAPVHLAGYSLGARLALGLLVRHSELFSAATLIGAQPGLDSADRATRAASDDHLAATLEENGLEAFLETWEKQPLFASQNHLSAELLEEQSRIRHAHDPHGLAWALRTLSPGRMPDFRRFLWRLQLPMWLLSGGIDLKFKKIATEMVRELPLGRHELVPGAGHNLVLEAPRRVARAIQEGNLR